jgi:hypothetical protein
MVLIPGLTRLHYLQAQRRASYSGSTQHHLPRMYFRRIEMALWCRPILQLRQGDTVVIFNKCMKERPTKNVVILLCTYNTVPPATVLGNRRTRITYDTNLT